MYPALSPQSRVLFTCICMIGLSVCAGCCRVTVKDIATDALDPNNLADTEPSIAVNPQNPGEIAIVAFSENWNATTGAPVWKSSDGGLTWRKVFQITQPAPSQSGPFDQKIDFDADGRIYVAEVALGSSISDYTYHQPGPPDAPLIPGANYGNDQPHLSLDRYPNSPQRGRLYSPWLDLSQTLWRSSTSSSVNQGVAMNSVGAGDNSTFANRTTRVAIGPDGRAYIVYKKRPGVPTTTPPCPAGSTSPDFENAQFTVNRSDDGGVTWTGLAAGGVSVNGAGTVETLFTSCFGNHSKGKVARARSSDAWIAAAPAGHWWWPFGVAGDIYVAYVSRDASRFAQIYVARSTDQGLSWSSKRATDGTHHSAYPEIAVTDLGVVGLLYIDYDDSGAATIFRHHFAFSSDHGQTWKDCLLQAMDPAPLANAADGFLWGDYEGLTALNNTFYGVFTGESSGRNTPQLDPVFFRQKICPWWGIQCWFQSN